MVRIVIAEDQTMVRQAPVALLELETVLDIEMPRLGIEVASRLQRAAAPGKVVIVTTFDRPGYLRAPVALALGDSPLTERETEVLAGAAGHDAFTQIAARLHLSPGTVRNHMSAAIQKPGARNRAEAVRLGQQKGWL